MDTEPHPPALRLRLARVARGITQEDLGKSAGVTRQAVAGIESGRWEPSLRVALALAGALGATVEDLFGPGDRPVQLDVGLAATSGPTTRVALAEVAGRTVAFGLGSDADLHAGFGPAGATVAPGTPPAGPLRGGPTVRAGTLGPVDRTLVVAGCDPALALLAPALARLAPPVRLLWWPCGSRAALDLLAQGAVHVAGVHRRTDPPEETLAADGRHLVQGGAKVIAFTSWGEGLAITPGAGDVADLAGAARRGLRLANREPGSEARSVLDRERARAGLDPGELPGYGTEVRGHLQVASAIRSGLAEVGVVCEPAALATGLRFVPLTSEQFDLVVGGADLGSPVVEGLLSVLGSSWLARQLAALAGYDGSRCGQVIGEI